MNIYAILILGSSILCNVIGGISLNSEITAKELALKEVTRLEAQAQHNEWEVERQSNHYNQLIRNRNNLQEVVAKQQAEIDQYMGREDVVYAKPGLVERLEKRAMDKFFKEIDSDDN